MVEKSVEKSVDNQWKNTFSGSIYAFIHPWLISPHHSDQMSQRSQVFNFSRRATRASGRGSQNGNPKVWPTDLHLTWVGARDACASKNISSQDCIASTSGSLSKFQLRVNWIQLTSIGLCLFSWVSSEAEMKPDWISVNMHLLRWIPTFLLGPVYPHFKVFLYSGF